MYNNRMILKCKRCLKEWRYGGKIKPNENYPQYTSCPRCRTSIKIIKPLDEDDGR